MRIDTATQLKFRVNEYSHNLKVRERRWTLFAPL